MTGAERFRRVLGAAPGTAAWLRAAVLAVSAAALWWSLTLAAGVAAAMFAAASAALAADAYGRAPRAGAHLRTTSVLGLAVACALAGLVLAHVGVHASLVPSALGPVGALVVTESLLALLITAPVVFVLRWLAVRRPALAALEIAAVAAAFAASTAAHREGMVHRPLALGDLAWSNGIDPTYALLALGGACLLLLAALLVTEERRARIPLHLGVLAVVALLLVLFVRISGLPSPRPAEDLGLSGEGEDAEDTAARRRGSGADTGDMSFKSEYDADRGQLPVAAVVLHDEYSPPTGVYYFRQSVFSQYNGRRLVQTTRDDVDRDVVLRFPSQRFDVPWTPPESEERAELRTTTGLLVDHVRPFALDSPRVLEPRATPNGTRFQRSFEALSLVQTHSYEDLVGRAPGDPSWTADIWRYYTEAPTDPRYLEIAREAVSILGPEYAADPLARALAVKAYLDENGIYSRKNVHADAADPTASFLFGDLTGYCVHFAHAAVFMLRSLGVPARVAAGYAVSESGRARGSTIMIRGLNAHAWPEIFLDGVGWVVVDLVPLQSLEPLAPRPDETLQRMLGEILRRGGSREAFGHVADRRLPTLGQLARWLATACLAAVIAGFAVKLWRALIPSLARPTALPRVSYRAALDRLAEAGLSRRFGESRERFARRAAASSPSFGWLTGVHLRAALGGRAATEAARLRRLPAAVRSELRVAVPRWRCWLGTLDPFAWVRAR